MASHAGPRAHRPDTNSGAFYMLATVLLGFLVAVIGLFALLMWTDTRDNSSNIATATSMDMSENSAAATGAGSLTSYAGAAPANADELATAHAPYPAALPAAPAGPVANVNLVLSDVTIDIAPGVRY